MRGSNRYVGRKGGSVTRNGGSEVSGRHTQRRKPPHPNDKAAITRVLTATTDNRLTDEQVELPQARQEFVDEQIIPVATELEHKDSTRSGSSTR